MKIRHTATTLILAGLCSSAAFAETGADGALGSTTGLTGSSSLDQTQQRIGGSAAAKGSLESGGDSDGELRKETRETVSESRSGLREEAADRRSEARSTAAEARSEAAAARNRVQERDNETPSSANVRAEGEVEGSASSEDGAQASTQTDASVSVN